MDSLKKILNFLPKFVFIKLKDTFLKATIKSLKHDLVKLRTRLRTKRMFKKYIRDNQTIPKNLHFGCGQTLIPNWLNIDLMNSDIDVDLSSDGLCLFEDNYFNTISSQHLIEHLDMHEELPMLFDHLYRILCVGGSLWLSTPSIEKIAKAYLLDGAYTLVQGRKKRFPNYSTKGFANSIIINDLFYQDGQHKNLFDFPLLKQLLERSKFSNITEVDYEEFFLNHSAFPPRNDEEQTIYVKAYKLNNNL